MITILENDLGIIPLYFNVGPPTHPFLSPPPFVTSSQPPDLGGWGTGEPRWLTRRLSLAAASWCKLPCFLISVAAAAAAGKKQPLKLFSSPKWAMWITNWTKAEQITPPHRSLQCAHCSTGFLYIQSSWLLLMSTALTFSWTSKNNCRTAGTKVYKYQPQFINTEFRVITGLTNIKRERMKRCRQEIIQQTRRKRWRTSE